MGKKQNRDVIEMFTRFRRLIENKPEAGKMFEEVRMMKFKIKPLQGDISFFNFRHPQLIETLWSLGKLDEFFQREFRSLTASQKGIFFEAFEDLYHRFQNQLNQINFRREQMKGTAPVIEMEIFKERPLRKKTN